MNIEVYGRDNADRTAKTEIAGDTLFELLQFMIRKKQKGLMVFDTVAELNTFCRRFVDTANTPLLMFIAPLNAFKVDGTWLHVVVLDVPESVLRLRGQRFDRVWWMGKRAMLNYRTEVQTHLLRLGNGAENKT